MNSNADTRCLPPERRCLHGQELSTAVQQSYTWPQITAFAFPIATLPPQHCLRINHLHTLTPTAQYQHVQPIPLQPANI